MIKYCILIGLLPTVSIATGYAFAAPEENSAVIPATRSGEAYKRFLDLNEKVQDNKGRIRLLFVGDSITERWEEEGKDTWRKFYVHRNALNIGIKGDRTQHVLWRLENGNIEGLSPEVAVVMIGTNNAAMGRNTASEVLAGVTAVTKSLKTRLPSTKILLLGIFPRGQKFNEQRGLITQVNQALHKLHDGRNIHFLDIGHLFLEMDGSISREVMPDGLHLSDVAYHLWAEAIEPFLSDSFDDSGVVDQNQAH